MSGQITLVIFGILCWAGSDSLFAPPQVTVPRQYLQPQQQQYLQPQQQQFLQPQLQPYLQPQQQQYLQPQLQQYLQPQLQPYLQPQQLHNYLQPQQVHQYVQQYTSPTQYYNVPPRYTVRYTQPQQQYGSQLFSVPQFAQVFANSFQQQPALTSGAQYTVMGSSGGGRYGASNPAVSKFSAPAPVLPAPVLPAPGVPAPGPAASV